MNRVGLKDYLLNHADDNDLLDCAKAWDAANGYGHLESVSKTSLLEDARDSIDDIIDWLGDASRYDLEGISSDIELFVNAENPFEIINEVDCSSRNQGNDIKVNLSRGDKDATLSFSKLDGIDAARPKATTRMPAAPAPRRCRRRFSRRTGAGCRPHVRTS